MDRGIFFLASTALGAGIGYVVGKSYGESLPGWITPLVGRTDRAATAHFTLTGALLGATGAGMYLYVEFFLRAVIWCAEACMNHPVRVLVVSAVAFGALVLAAILDGSQDKEDKPPKGQRV